jgi:hypothetical protein
MCLFKNKNEIQAKNRQQKQIQFILGSGIFGNLA